MNNFISNRLTQIFATLSLLFFKTTAFAGATTNLELDLPWYSSPWLWITAAVAFVFVLSKLLGSNKRPL